MKQIIKVAVIPLDEDGGNIIDSFNTTDDKHLNAPSIAAVEGKFAVVTKTVKVATSSYGPFTKEANGIINYPEGFDRSNSSVISAKVIQPYGGHAALPNIFYDNNKLISDVFNYEYISNTEISVYYAGNVYDIDDDLTFELVLMKK